MASRPGTRPTTAACRTASTGIRKRGGRAGVAREPPRPTEAAEEVEAEARWAEAPPPPRLEDIRGAEGRKAVPYRRIQVEEIRGEEPEVPAAAQRQSL